MKLGEKKDQWVSKQDDEVDLSASYTHKFEPKYIWG